MSRGLVPILVNLVVFGGVPEKRRLEGQKWAWRHQAHVEARWVPDVERCLDRNRRVLLWGIGFIWLALVGTGQDAMRADVLRSPAALVGGSATLASIAVIGVSDGRHQLLTLVTAAVLLTPEAILGTRVQRAPAAHMRARLWPMPSEHEVLSPGQPVPTPGATS